MIIEDAGLIADALVITAAGSRDPHWDESAKNFIEALILHVATDPAYEASRNLITVRGLIKHALTKLPNALDEASFGNEEDDEPKFVVKEQMLANADRLQKTRETEHIGSAIEGGALDFYEKSDRERSAVLSTVRRHTKLLDYAAMKGVLSGNDFDLSELKANPKGVSVYLCLPASRMGICNRWLRLFINQLLDTMERKSTVADDPVLVCMDGFPF